MKKNYYKRLVILFFGILLIVSSLSTSKIENELSRYDYFNQENYNLYSPREQHTIQNDSFNSVSNTSSKPRFFEKNEFVYAVSDGGLMDSSWPMQSHDIRHTGRSPFTTINNTGVELWNVKTDGWATGGPTIDENGTLYIGSYYLNAVYLNGTLKWSYYSGILYSAPAIDSKGVIYFGNAYGDGYFNALYPNGTLKWKYHTGNVFSSPAIGTDGTIYFGSDNHYINALYPNGTLKWNYQTGHVVYSSPAIGQDGTIYCGCHDTYLYALYPNGTLKWRYKTGDWIRTSPCIGDDNTIYTVSRDSYLYALYPNGTLKWKTDVNAGTSPTIGLDGIIYCGWDHLYAIYPNNGSIKWSFDPHGVIEASTPCTSVDGTIYFGTSDHGDLIAVNPDGTEKWRRHIGSYVDSPPAIGEDGTVYVGVDNEPGKGHLFAFGQGPLEVDANGPYSGVVDENIQFTGTIFGGIPPYIFHWDFGDGNTSNEQNPMHKYTIAGNYTATFTVTDNQDNTSNDTALVTITYGPPTITITKPINGIYFMNIKVFPFVNPFVIGPITIDVTASHEQLEINRVEFYLDDTLQATDMTASYSYRWNGFSFGRHEIKVIAYDVLENTASDEITVWKFF